LPPAVDEPSRAGGSEAGNGSRRVAVAATAARTQDWWQEKLHRLTLHARVTLLAAVAVGLAVAFVSLSAYLTVRQQMYRNLDDSLIDRAQQAARNRVLTNLKVLQDIPPEALGLSDIRIGLYTIDGSRLGAVDAYLPPMGSQELTVAREQGSEVSVRTVGDRKGPHYRVVAVPASYCPLRDPRQGCTDPDQLQPAALVVAQSLARSTGPCTTWASCCGPSGLLGG
jgi:two-component system sensor histidine kinase MprB